MDAGLTIRLVIENVAIAVVLDPEASRVKPIVKDCSLR